MMSKQNESESPALLRHAKRPVGSAGTIQMQTGLLGSESVESSTSVLAAKIIVLVRNSQSKLCDFAARSRIHAVLSLRSPERKKQEPMMAAYVATSLY